MPDPEDSSRELIPRKGGELIRRMDRRVELANQVVGEIQAKQDLKRIDMPVTKAVLAIYAARHTKCDFGLPSIFGAEPNYVERVSRKIGKVLCDVTKQDYVSMLYWAVGNGGALIEVIQDRISQAECSSIEITGPKRHSWGTGTKILPLIKYIVDEHFDKAGAAMGVILTDGIIEDEKDAMAYCMELGKRLDAEGKADDFKLVLIGVGPEVDEDQLERFDNMFEDTDLEESVDIWSSGVATDMKNESDILAVLLGEIRESAAARNELAKQDLKRIDLKVAQRFLDNPHPNTAGPSYHSPSAGAVSLVEHQLLDDDAAELLSKGHLLWLYLDGLTDLSDAAAESLSRFEGRLSLNGLKELSDAGAESLSGFEGLCLNLGGLDSLSDAAADSLSRFGCDLSLSGVTALSDAAAESLSRFKGSLFLDSLTELSDTVAESLSRLKGSLFLDSLTELSDTAADSLSRFKGLTLSLDGLTELSDTAADSLSRFKGLTLSLSGLTELSDTASDSLSNLRGNELRLNGLTELSASAAKSLSKLEGPDLYLNGLQELSHAVAESLSGLNNEGLLSLNGLTTLSDAAAKALSRYWGKRLNLNGLTELSDAAAESLTGFRGNLYLNGLQELSDAAAKSLSKNNRYRFLALWGLTELSDAAAESFSRGEMLYLDLRGLTELSDAAAESLSRCGDMHLPNLSEESRAKLEKYRNARS